MSKKDEIISELAHKVVTLKNSLEWQERIPEIKYSMVSAIHDMIVKIKSVSNEDAKAWWNNRVAVLYQTVTFFDQLLVEKNELEVFNGKLLEENKLLRSKVKELQEENDNLYKVIEQKI